MSPARLGLDFKVGHSDDPAFASRATPVGRLPCDTSAAARAGTDADACRRRARVVDAQARLAIGTGPPSTLTSPSCPL